MSLWCFPSCFGSIQLIVWEEMSFEEFQDGRHDCPLGYLNQTILAILNPYVAPMPSIKFQLNLTYGLGWPWWPSWTSERNDFSNSESLCYCNASHLVSAQSNLWFGKCHLKNFKMATMATILDIRTEQFSQFPISVSLWCLPSSFNSSDLRFGRRCPLKDFKMAAILDIRMEWF